MLRKAVIILLLWFPAAAFAEADMNYNFAQVSYAGTDHANGFGLTGSLELTDMIFGSASFVNFKPDHNGSDIQAYHLGIGLHSNQFTDALDLLGEVSYERSETDGTGGSQDGFGLLVGARGMVTPEFELNGGIKYVYYDIANIWSFSMGGLYHFTQNWSVGAGYGISHADNGGDSVDNWNVLLRYSF